MGEFARNWGLSWKSRKREKFESFVPVTDTLLEKARRGATTCCAFQTPAKPRLSLLWKVKQILNLVNLWMKAADLEHDKSAKKRVLRKALDRSDENLRCIRQWKLVGRNSVMTRIQELCFIGLRKFFPGSFNFGLVLRGLETYEAAKKIFNNAKKTSSKRACHLG
ncbi:hypothetical protein M0R45_026772 [Rubus argutus]|uniref:Uncharacterized protein n=1 Tax=Rubus argutus TaxID=59490 RepID=A0AAW1X112_RUBAR